MPSSVLHLNGTDQSYQRCLIREYPGNISMPIDLFMQPFLRDAIIGSLRSVKSIVCQMARHLPKQQPTFLSMLDRLEDHLVKNNDFDNKVKSVLPETWLPFVQDDTPIILDLSDIAKFLSLR